MRRCGVCGLAFRANDPGGTCDVPSGNHHNASPGHYSACSDCCHEYSPGSTQFQMNVAAMASAPIGGKLRSDGVVEVSSRGSGSADAHWCDMCRRWAREGDTMQQLRIYPEDCPEEPDLFQRVFHITIANVGPVEVEALTEEAALAWFRQRFGCPDGEPTIAVGNELRPSSYYACGECRKKYGPMILTRLKRLKLAPADLEPWGMSFNMLG